MKQIEVSNTSNNFLTDDKLSLGAKGFLALKLLGYFHKSYDATKYCSDDFLDIEDIIHELRRTKYLKYDQNTSSLIAAPFIDENLENEN